MNKQAVLFLLFYFVFQVLAAQNAYITDRPVNIGVKFGFNSAAPDVDIRTEDGLLAPKITNKVGYMAEAFMRMNIKKFYIQPEVSYSITKGKVEFIQSDQSTYVDLDMEVSSVDLSALFGYNTVKEAQYGLGVFAGLKTRVSSRAKVKYLGMGNTDKDFFYNTYITVGLGVNISRLFFDFRYDIALKENEMTISPILSQTYGEVKMVHKANILGFSIGIMF